MFQAMINVLKSKGAEPQVLWDPLTDRLGQFMPLDHTGRALKNDGSYRSNRIGKVCIQIEVIGYSKTPFTGYWKPGPNFRALMAAIRSWGIPDVFPMGNPPKYPGGSVRDRNIWLTKAGHFCHANIPGNDHGDPGAISVSALFAAAPTAPAKPPAKPVTPSTEDEMSAKDVEDGIDNYMQRYWSKGGTGGINRAEDEAWQKAMLDGLNRLAAAVEALKGQ
jgi:hypothetical protein